MIVVGNVAVLGRPLFLSLLKSLLMFNSCLMPTVWRLFTHNQTAFGMVLFFWLDD